MMGVQDRVKGRYGDKIAYLDLFAGPGRYDDGTKSTPLMILEKPAIANDKLRNRLVSIFNDKDDNNTRSLQEAIKNLPGIDSLRYKPKVHRQEVGSEIVKLFEQMKMIPTFFFVDPWVIKGFLFSSLMPSSRIGDAIACFSSTTTELAWAYPMN
jgi:three-Cys-motif partner protein